VRLAKRREGWREAAEAQGVTPVFVDLENPDLAAVERDLNAAIDRALRLASAR
jgi:LmbE family N-acetylglucosaminyl deacetylase